MFPTHYRLNYDVEERARMAFFSGTGKGDGTDDKEPAWVPFFFLKCCTGSGAEEVEGRHDDLS